MIKITGCNSIGLMVFFGCALALPLFMPVLCGASAPAAPTSVNSSDVASDYGSQIAITWTKSADDGGGQNNVIGYNIYRATFSLGYDYTRKLTVLSSNTQSYMDYTTNDGTTYYYMIRASSSSSAGESGTSNEAHACSLSNLNGSEILYDFSSNAGVDRWFYENKDYSGNCRPPSAGPYVGAEKQQAYTDIQYDDNLRYLTNNGNFNVHLCVFTVQESTASISKLKIRWDGYSAPGDSQLYIWNNRISTWSFAGSHIKSSADGTIVASYGSNFSDYITSSGLVFFLAQRDAAKGDTNTEYVNLVVVKKASTPPTDNTYPNVVSIYPEDGKVGVLADTSIHVVFSENMDETKTLQSVSLRIITDKDGIASDIAVPASAAYFSSENKITLNPVSKLDKSSVYRIIVSTEAADTAGNSAEKAVSSVFSTIIDSKRKNVVKDEKEKTKIVIEENTIQGDFSVRIITDPLNEARDSQKNSINDAVNKAVENGLGHSALIAGAVREINMYSADGEPVKRNFDKPVQLTIPYTDADKDGFVDGANPPIREKTIRMYYLDEAHNLWVRVPGSAVDKAAKTVTAPCIHFSVYALIGAVDTDLSEAYAFPVPFMPSRGDTAITFTNLSSLATIRIYTITGELARTIEHTSGNAQLQWDCTNDNGEKLFSGTYLYTIKNEKESMKGKLMIIR